MTLMMMKVLLKVCRKLVIEVIKLSKRNKGETPNCNIWVRYAFGNVHIWNECVREGWGWGVEK